MVSDVAVSEAEVLVNTWSAWEVLALSSKAGHSCLSERTLGENSGVSG